VLCDADCAVVVGEAPDRGDGTPFDFDLGLIAQAAGLALAIETGGSAYIVGPLDALGTIELQAGEVQIGDEIVGGGSIEVPPRGEITIVVSDTVIVAPEPPRTIGGGGLVVSSGGDIQVAASTPLDPASSGGPISISREGDIYLDLAGVELASLSVTAGVSIVSREEKLTLVPEPATALLVALGLALLGAGQPAHTPRN
jgi:hypothetical protein